MIGFDMHLPRLEELPMLEVKSVVKVIDIRRLCNPRYKIDRCEYDRVFSLKENGNHTTIARKYGIAGETGPPKGCKEIELVNIREEAGSFVEMEAE